MNGTPDGGPRVLHGSPRALLIQPPIYDFALYDLFHQPFGLMRIGTWLQNTGYDVTLLDCLGIDDPANNRGRPRRRPDGTGKFLRRVVPSPTVLRPAQRRYARYGISESTILARVRSARPDLVLIGTGMTYWYEGGAEIARLVRQISLTVPLIAGGVYATLLPAHCAKRLQTEHVVVGPATPSLAAILAKVGLPVPQDPLPYQPGPALRSASGRLRGAAILRLNDGCPFSCDYCASQVLHPGFQRGDAQALATIVEETNARWSTRHFAFYDDALLHQAQTSLVVFLERIVGRFGRRQLSFYVPNAVHARRITPSLAALMYQAGFREMRLGIESDDPEFHLSHGKKLDVNRLRECVATLKHAGFAGRDITGYLLAGIPGQSADEFAHSLNTLETLGIRASVAEYSPVPGTPLFDLACEQSTLPLRDEPLCHNNSLFALSSAQFTREDLQRLKDRAQAHNRSLICATM